MNIFNNEEWKTIVAHTWSSAYLLKNYGAHFRKFARVLSKAQTKTTSDWTGVDVWGSPIVAMAPPFDPLKYGTPRKVIILPEKKHGKPR